MSRIPQSERVSQAISSLLEGTGAGEHPMDELFRLSSQYMLQVALEKEVLEFLGRAHYQRDGRLRNGWRNGYEHTCLRVRTGREE